jgi:hypothetical protein
MNIASFEYLKIVYFTLFFIHRNNFATLAVYNKLIFYRVSFFLPEYAAF